MLAAAAGALALAAPASAEPVKAGPATPDELAVLAVGGSLATPAANRTDQLAVHRFSTADGGYRGRIVFPSTDPDALTVTTIAASQIVRQVGLERSVDGRYLTFAGIKAPANAATQDATRSTAVRVAADGTWTDTLLGTGFLSGSSQRAIGALTVDGSRYWVGTNTAKAFGTVAPGDTVTTQVTGALNGANPTTVSIVDGSLYATSTLGVSRLAGPLPTALDAVTRPEQVITQSGAFDSAFVDTDGVAGADTAYISRGNAGLSKFVLDGGQWAPRGNVAGAFDYVTARAVDGAVEIYATGSTNGTNGRVLKVVDTAEIGGQLASTGATTISYAPARLRFAGLAFTPGNGFPSDPTPHPPAPPVAFAAPTSLETHVGATPAVTTRIEVFDPNTPASEITVTASSNAASVLPNDRITISGSGSVRTVTFEPVGAGTATVTLAVRAGDDVQNVPISVRASGPPPDPTGHYYTGVVDLSAAIDAGGDYFLGISDEVNTIHLYKKGVSGSPVASFGGGFPGGETDFEGATRFGDMLVWSASHGNNRSGSARPERRYLGFTRVTGSGANTSVDYAGYYTRLWDQWKAWDAANGHGLGANKLKFNTATVPGLIPNAPNGFNVEGMAMAPGSDTVAWFGMRAPTITGADGVERALILPVNNIDKLTSDAVDAELGQPIFLDLGGRSIRDMSQTADDQYLISAGTGDTDDSLKGWALFTWDGNPSHDPKYVKELPTDESNIGAWEGIAELPARLEPGARVLMTADSGDTSLGKSYGQYVTLGEPVAGPPVATGVTAVAKPGEIEVDWDAAAGATAYFVTAKTAAGAHAPGSPRIVTGTSTSLKGLAAGTEYTVAVRSQNYALRAANSATVTATPTQGQRVVTTTTVHFEGTPMVGSPDQRVYAVISDPGAEGTVQFFDGNSTITDAVATVPVPGCNCVEAKRVFDVVDGKAEVNVTEGKLSTGLVNLRAVYTTANPENHVSSQSPILSFLNDHRPYVPGVQITSVTGDRVVGGRVTITAKLLGYTPSQLYTGELDAEFAVRLNGGTARTRMTGDTPDTQTGYATFDANGVATFSTTALPAGDHRLTVDVGNYSRNYAQSNSDELPLKIVATAPAPAAPEIARTRIGLTVSGSRIASQPLTLTARLSDPSAAGTVQFFTGASVNVGQAVPVVNGIATYTGTVSGSPTQTVFARFEPAANRDRTASAVSLGVPLLRANVEPPLPPAPATATTLELTGERVVGEPLSATVTVAAQPEDGRTVNGYVEVLDRGAVLGIWPVIAGKAEVDLGGLGAGAHALQARYVPADLLRSQPSESATQAFDVVVTTEQDTGVGGNVPATLALTLGTPAGFGAFTPGVTRDYTAATTATVTSSAGDAALTVADPSSTAPGHLVNGAFSLPQALKARAGTAAFAALGGTPLALTSYGGPVSNAVETVELQQSIGAGDALRTGAYAKTLTFTLSTTTP